MCGPSAQLRMLPEPRSYSITGRTSNLFSPSIQAYVTTKLREKNIEIDRRKSDQETGGQ